MGKYIKKSKSPGEVGGMDASQFSAGARTRVKTLALQRLQSSASHTPLKSDLGCLELRSRRLVKRPPRLRKCMQSSRVVSFANDNGFTSGENRGFGSRKGCSGSDLKAGSVGPWKGEDACLLRKSRGLESGDLGIEVSFGESNSESEDRDTYSILWDYCNLYFGCSKSILCQISFPFLRSDGESTRYSFIKVADSSTIPGSTMKQTSIAPAGNQRAQNARFVDMPTTDEVEEFFTLEEQLWQRLFIEKYNFDVANDLPLPGRYEWVKKSP